MAFKVFTPPSKVGKVQEIPLTYQSGTKLFEPSRAEWSADNKEALNMGTGAVGTAITVIYEVPKGKTAYITSALITGHLMSYPAAPAASWLNFISFNEGIIIAIRLGQGNNTTATGYPCPSSSVSLTFPIPIKVKGNQQIVLQTKTDCYVNGYIFGWIETTGQI